MDILRASAIDTVLVCGLITSVCVQHSAFGVFEAGYRTLLVQDACADRGRARHEAALALYGGYMYELITSVELSDPVHGLQKAKPVWITVEDTRGEGIKRRGVTNTTTAVGAAGVVGGKGLESQHLDHGSEHGKKTSAVSPCGGNSSVVSL
jgi:Amidases related to nicotinamidase